MKPVQILMDEELLAGLDEDEEVIAAVARKCFAGWFRPFSRVGARPSWTRSTGRAMATTSG
jgi:hypothetical protein